MSAINTNGINVNYPTAGVNNNSQGFRDNFGAIANNLNIAGAEISDLQNKVVLKQALANTVVNNDMAGTLISNALTKSFAASTYNLGNSLSGTVSINASLGDVQYGTITGNTQLSFSNWTSNGVQSLVLSFNVSNSSATLSFPSANVAINNSSGVITLENNVAGTANVTFPNGVGNVEYEISTQDCGNTLLIQPLNRPRKTNQIVVRTPTNTGAQGDVAGTMCADSSYLYICTGTYNGSSVIWKRIALSAF